MGYTKTDAVHETDVPKWYSDGDVPSLETTYFKGGTAYDYKEETKSFTWTPERSCPDCVKEGKYYDKNDEKWKFSVQVAPCTEDKKKPANIYNYNNDEGSIGTMIRDDDDKMLRKYCDNCKTKGKILLKPVTATRELDGWKKMTANRPHYVNKEKGCIIFFCAIQNKWHMCGPSQNLLSC